MNQKILLVDDSSFSRKMNREILESLEYEVIAEAEDGIDGIMKLQEFQPDIIITDIEMPNLDGMSMVQEMRKDNANIKIIIVSTVVNSQIIQEAKRLGIPIIKKPIKEAMLVNALKILTR